MPFFHELFYRPFLNALVFLYEYFSFHDFGIAIILLTIVVRLILFPLFWKGFKSQMAMQRMAPRMKELKERHKHDREAQARALMDLHREHGVNPFTSILLLLVQFPILIGLYQVFLRGISAAAFPDLYSFVPPPSAFTSTFLGLVDLAKPNMVLVALTAVAQYAQMKFSLPAAPAKGGDSAMDRMNRQMVYLMPVFIVLILMNFPSAVALYWLTTTFFSVMQQMILRRRFDNARPAGAQAAQRTQ